MTPEDLERQKRIAQSKQKIAKSQATATPVASAGHPGAGGGPISSKPSFLQQAGMKIGKQLLGSALGPLGGVLGGLFNDGGEVEERKKRRYGPKTRAVFEPSKGGTGFRDTGERVPANVIKGYADRPAQGQTQGLVDTYDGIAQQIQAAKAAGQPVDYNALAALQHARSSGNKQKEMEAMRMFLQKHPNFRMPGGSQAVVRRNMGGPISRNPHGYNEGGSVMETPLKKVMDEDKIEMAREAFQRAEARKDQKAAADERRAQETHKQAMSMKKASATTNKAPLAKKS